MHTGHRFSFLQTFRWSQRNLFVPLLWAAVVTAVYEIGGLKLLAIPSAPLSLLGVAVAFYLGFKNNASYERLWEARKIWGGIVNASRSWAYGARDLVSLAHGSAQTRESVTQWRRELIMRHIAWLDALRFQLRALKSWEHTGARYDGYRDFSGVPERVEKLSEVLAPRLSASEKSEVLAQINPAARLLANQSRALAHLRDEQLLDGFAHMELQRLLQELMAQQGKAERIKNFPFPRQYSTVNRLFALLFTLLLPFALLGDFEALGPHAVWMTLPFSALVSWVFLTADQIGEWSENPFEGLANDVPITQMARGIERDMLQMIDATDLPPAREARDMILL